MTQFKYWNCDECGKILVNCECHKDQLMFTLIANYDTSGSLGERNPDGSYKAHFCGHKCLIKYVKNKVKDHHDLPIIKDGKRTIENGTYGDMLNEKEREE